MWSNFQDEHSEGEVLSQVQRKIWNARMEVKIKQAETLIKELTTQSANKKVSKFKPGDVFERFSRDLKAELITVPLCLKRLDEGPLVN